MICESLSIWEPDSSKDKDKSDRKTELENKIQIVKMKANVIAILKMKVVCFKGK